MLPGGKFRPITRGNINALQPISYSTLTKYLECPGCTKTYIHNKRARKKEIKTFSRQLGELADDLRWRDRVPVNVGGVGNRDTMEFIDFVTSGWQKLLRSESSKPAFKGDLQNKSGSRLESRTIQEKKGLAEFMKELAADRERSLEFVSGAIRYREHGRRARAFVMDIDTPFAFQAVVVSIQNEMVIQGRFDEIRMRKGAPDEIWEVKYRVGKITPSHALQVGIQYLAKKCSDLDGFKSIHSDFAGDTTLPIIYSFNDGIRHQLTFEDPEKTVAKLVDALGWAFLAFRNGYFMMDEAHHHLNDNLPLPGLESLDQTAVWVDDRRVSVGDCFRRGREKLDEYWSDLQISPIESLTSDGEIEELRKMRAELRAVGAKSK